MTGTYEYAITITSREQAALLPVERDPGPLGPTEVAGRTLCTAVSTGTELAAAYQGSRFPNTPGYAAVFEVEEIGSEVPKLQPGDPVLCLGPHRSFQRTARELVVPVPATLEPEVAVLARLMCVSMSTLTTTTARPPEKVLVTGLGPVGHIGAAIFRSCGYEVIGCDPSAVRRGFAIAAGIRPVLPSVPVDDPSVAGQVALVLECSGHEQAVLDGCRVVKKRGEVVLVGVPWRRHTDLYAHELLDIIFHKYAVVRGGWEWEVPNHPTDFRTNSIYGNLAAALRWLAEGRICVDGLYQTASPPDAQRVYQDLLHQRWPKLVAVFDWRAQSAQ